MTTQGRKLRNRQIPTESERAAMPTRSIVLALPAYSGNPPLRKQEAGPSRQKEARASRQKEAGPSRQKEARASRQNEVGSSRQQEEDYQKQKEEEDDVVELTERQYYQQLLEEDDVVELTELLEEEDDDDDDVVELTERQYQKSRGKYLKRKEEKEEDIRQTYRTFWMYILPKQEGESSRGKTPRPKQGSSSGKTRRK